MNGKQNSVCEKFRDCRCGNCPFGKKIACEFRNDEFRFKKFHVSTIQKFVELTLYLRSQGYYSFRGHRDRKWELSKKFRMIEERDEFNENLKNFKRRCLALPKKDYISEEHEWRWLFFAQHHGLSTKLLDWSSNPLVALYFAVENIISGKVKADEEYGVVWALKVSKDRFLTPREAGDPSSLEEWIMINPPPITPRIENQSGKFSYHPDPELDLIKSIGCKENNRRYCDVSFNDEIILICIIPHQEGENTNNELRRHLGIMNIHHASMFPDADGIAGFINNEWHDL